MKVLGIHAAGSALMAACALAGTILYTGQSWYLIFDPQLGGSTLRALASQAVTGALVWPLLVVMASGFRRLGTSFAKPEHTYVMSRKGTALIETIIALPIILLLTFGLAQFAVNNIAAVMMNYATFSASRAAWVWEGEGDLGMAAERARVAAAVALTPVAYGGRLAPAEAESRALREARGMLVAAQYPGIFATMGQNGVTEGEQLVYESNTELPSMADALVETSFKARTAQQMTAAHRATIVTLTELGDELETKVQYQHYIAMPFVSRIFGRYATVQGKRGAWMLFERSYTRARMTESNRNVGTLVGEDLFPRLL